MTYKRYKQKEKKNPLIDLHHVTMKAVFETYKRNVSTASTDSVDKKEPSQRDKHLFFIHIKTTQPPDSPSAL